MQKTLIATLLLASFLMVHGTVLANDKAKILIVNSYHAEYPWVVAHNSVLIEELGTKAVLTFAYLDAKRLDEKEKNNKVNEVLELFSSIQPDLVILTDDFALKSLGPRIQKTKTPVVFLGINNNPRNYVDELTQMTGVLERPLLKRSIAYIQEILDGKMNKALVLFDNGMTAKTTMDHVFRGKDRLVFDWTDVDIQLVETYVQWKKAVMTSKQKGYDAVFLGLYHTIQDEHGNHVDDGEIATWTSQNSPLPLFAFWDFAVGADKAVGGLILSGEPQRKEAVKLAIRILSGVSPQDIQPVTAEHGRFIFSRSGLKKWNLILPKYFNNPNEQIMFVD